MDERAVCETMLVRAIEREDAARTIVSEADLLWAGDEAARRVGAGAGLAAYAACRAALVLERVVPRQPALRHALQIAQWRRWAAPVVLLAALVAGGAVHRVGQAASIDILAPPVLSLLAWNVLVYLVLSVRAATRRSPTTPRGACGARALFVRLAARMPRGAALPGPPALARAIGMFAAEWSSSAAPVHAARAACVLHLAAALFAAGVIAGLYLRGLAVEFHASWQSTFLDAEHVHRLLAFVLAPGAWLTGIPVPSIEEIAALRTTAPGGGENAARWLHLHAATVVAIVVIPRLLLATASALTLARRAAGLQWPADDAYLRRLARHYQGERTTIAVIPYSFQVVDTTRPALELALRGAFGPRTDVTWVPAVDYGAEDSLAADVLGPAPGILVGLFNATATPEEETHGRFVDRLQTMRGTAQDVIAVVDETAWRLRFPEDVPRLEQRRAAWRAVLASRGIPVVCLSLDPAGLPAAEAALLDVAGRTVHG